MTTPEDFTELAKAAKDYADAILMQPLSQLGGILSDTVGYWRFKNQVRLMLKSKVWLESKGIDPERMLPDVFVPLLEDGGNAQDPSLSDMFASLLSCHLDPAASDTVHPSYTKVLAQLSPIDARTMLYFRSRASYREARSVGLRGGVFTSGEIAQLLSISNDASYLSVLNLHRLGIIEMESIRIPEGHPVPDMFRTIGEHQEYRITEYGIAFCDACHHCAADDELYAIDLIRTFSDK